MDLSRDEQNIDEYFWIGSSAEVRNDMESAWIIVEGSRSRKLADFPKPSHRFSKYVTIICSPMFLIHFFCYSGKRRRFLLPGTYAFLTLLFMFLWLFLTKYDKIMSKKESKFAQKEVFCRKSRIEWNTRQDWSGFLDISDAYIWFLVEVNAFQIGKKY